jgi:hypothetical protein
MTDLTHNFDLAGQQLAARAAQGRIAAINASRQLQWLVELREGETTVTMAFDEAPTMIDVAIRRRTEGRPGPMDIRSVTVGRKAERPFMLMPAMRLAQEPADRSEVPAALARARARVARAVTPRAPLFRVV